MSYRPPIGAATASTRGILKLAGDLGGTADLPTVSNMSKATLGGQETVSNVTTSTSSTTLSLASGNVFSLTMTMNTTVNISGATNGKACSCAVYIKQDATGGRVVTWPASVKWSGGSQPALSAAPNAVDVVVFESLDAGTTWYGSLVGTAFA